MRLVASGVSDEHEALFRHSAKCRFVLKFLQRVEYSLDASRWRVVYPMDGIADSRRQAFEIRLDDASAGNVIIRATDAMNNVATAVAEIRK